MTEIIKLIDLTQFDGDGGNAAAGAGEQSGAEAPAAEESVLDAADRRQLAAARERMDKRYPMRNIRYGKQPEQQPQKPENAVQTEDDLEKEWAEAKKGRFAQLYQRDFQNALNDRLKNHQADSERLKKLDPMIQALVKKGGVENEDELIRQVMDDDSLYEDEASRMQMSVPAYKKYKAMEQQVADAQKQEQMQLVRKHYDSLQQQAQEFRKTHPGFDLDAELQNNPAFFRLVSPGVGIGVKQAYLATHYEDEATRGVVMGARAAQQAATMALQANRNRPEEGGLSSNPAIDVRSDPSKWSRADRAEVLKRVMRGDDIVL